MIHRLLIIFFSITAVIPTGFAQPPEISNEDRQFLELVQQKAFQYFLKEHHPSSGLVKDKASNFAHDSSTIASIAATGFGLTAMVVGADRGWISHQEAQKYCAKTLRFALQGLEAEHGFFYHFIHWQTGKKTKNTELSSIDTALFLAGALTAGQYFKGTEVEQMAGELYRRVDFSWMLNNGKTLSMGWGPREGFLKQRWSDYNESLILYALAVGSPTHAISPGSWREVNKRVGIYGSYVLVFSPPLFTHQYPLIWLDLRNRNDGVIDYFENSKVATLVNRQFCLDQREKFKTYSENIWGLTAAIGPNGYKAYGSGPGQAVHDGTVAPTAPGGSIVFTPELSLAALKSMYETHKDKLWGKYGFSDSFNLDRNWFAQEVIAIDQGPLLLMIENYRSELIWKLFMQNSDIQRGLEKMGFRAGTLKAKIPKRPRVTIKRAKPSLKIDGLLDDWNQTDFVIQLAPPYHRELGEISGPGDLSGRVAFAWDPNFLYAAARIHDDDIVARVKGAQIWRNDLLELFIDPAGNGFEWKNPKDFQLGLGPGTGDRDQRSWVWPKNFDPEEKGLVNFNVQRRSGGYDVEAQISWNLVEIKPRPGVLFGLSPALHDQDQDHTEGKLTWFFLPEGKTGKNLLGEATLSHQQE